MLTRISPASAVPNWASTHSLQLAAQMPIRSPFCEAERLEPDGEVLGALEKLGVGPAHVLMTGDLRDPLRALAVTRRSSAPIVSPSSGVALAP